LGSQGIAFTGNVGIDASDDGFTMGSNRAFELNKVSLIGNHFYNCGGSGIVGGPPSARTTISGNVIEGCGGHGVDLHGGRGLVANNVVSNTGNPAIVNRSNSQARGFVVTGNRVGSSSGPGIIVHSPKVQGALVTGNLIASTGSWDTPAIRILSNDGGDTVERFLVANNAGTRDSSGIDIDASASDFIVAGNRMNDPVAYAGTVTDTEVVRANKPKAYALDTTATFAGGETKLFAVGSVGVGRELDVAVEPATVPGNALGFRLDGTIWDDTGGTLAVRVTETEDDGGGDARISAKVVG
jgi:parallel beta-helix repeat protein